MPFSASPLLAPSTFPFLSYLGGILFCIFKIVLLSFFFPVLVPRRLFCLCHEGSLAFFCFLVFFFSVFFLSICPSLPFYSCLKGSALIEDPCFFILCRGLFFGCFFLFWASGSSGPSFYSPMSHPYLLLWA